MPLALKLFPGMLPSTFKEDFKVDEERKRNLQLRLQMAGLLQEMILNMETSALAKREGEEMSIPELWEFIDQTRKGVAVERVPSIPVGCWTPLPDFCCAGRILVAVPHSTRLNHGFVVSPSENQSASERSAQQELTATWHLSPIQKLQTEALL